MTLPITKDGFMRTCKALNMHCTERMAFEGLIFCRGKDMENAPPDDFDFDKMIHFLFIKSKTVAPADKPNFNLTTKMPKAGDYHTVQSYQEGGHLPPLRNTMHMTNRSRKVQSRQSYDSGDQRVTQQFRSGRLRQQRSQMDGSEESPDRSQDPLNRTQDEDMGYDSQEMSPAKMKKALQQDPSFQAEMHTVLEHMEKKPSLRAKVFNDLGKMMNAWND